jgi:hypothetical protein
MNWQEVIGEWQRLGPLLKSKWGKLTEEDLAAEGDKRDLLIKALERHYGVQRKHAELQLDRWVSALSASPPPGALDGVVAVGKGP